ncbi:MAG: protein kinase domain-containing protein, partial [Gemmatimonadales bacterium]
MPPVLRPSTSLSVTDLLSQLQSALGTAYRIERELGGGGMSRVFLAEEARLGRKVVVKVLPPGMSAAVQTERFEREIQLAASLQHPHIVPLLTAGAAGDLLYYVMPFIEGESLDAKLAREGALPVPEAVRILRDVVDALAYSHGRGVIHRDIKPANVMLSGRHAMVTDFGVAKAVTASSQGAGSLTSLGIALGTPAYMAPEQAAADPNVDHRADLYAIGAVAYEMLAGRKPYEAPTPQAMLAAHVSGSPDPVSRYRASIPPALAGAVMRCLEKHPADRWQNAAELGQALEAAITPSGGTTPVSTAPYPAAAESRQGHAARVAALFAFAALGVTVLAFAATRIAGLPDWVWMGAAALMAIGFPIMLYTSRLERRRAEALTRGTLRFEPEPAHHGWFTWRRALLGGALALGGLTILAVGYAGARALGIGPGRTLVSSGLLGATDRLILADFANRTSDSTLGPSLTEALRVDLAQSKVVRLLGAREIAAARIRMQLPADAPADEAVALEIAKREGAKAVIAGEIAPLGRGFVLTARVIETATGEERVAVRETAADPDHLLSALDDLSASLRERVGESLKSIRAGEPLERVATPSLEALRVYSAGVRAFEEGDYEDAVPLLEKAIRADSGFGMAWRKLAVTLGNLGTRRTEARDAAQRTYQLRDRLPPVERYLAEALYFSNVEFAPDRAIAAYRAALDFDPAETAARNNLGLMLNRVERFAEAEVVLRQGLEQS